MQDTLDADVLIIGGGLAGLACAVSLLPVVGRVVLVEASPRLGGRAASWSDAVTGDVIDIGPHILLTEYRNMLRLLDMLGTRALVTWQTDRLITLVDGREQSVVRLHRLPPPLHMLPSLLGARPVSLRDKNSNLPVLRLAMGMREADLYRLDRTPALELLRALGVTPRFIDWFWRTGALALLDVPLECCSAGALLRLYAQLSGHNDYRIGFPGVGLAELFVPAARERIAKAGGELREACPVARLLLEDGRCHGAVTARGEVLRARHTVLAVTPQVAAGLLPDAGAAWRAFEPSPYVSVYLWFDRKLTQHAFWARAWKPADLNTDFYDLSNIRSGWERRPSLIASNSIYNLRADESNDAAIVARTVEEIAEFAPAAAQAQVLHSVVHRIPMAVPCPWPGTEQARPPPRTAIPRLTLAGDWISTGYPASMESAVCAGFRAAEAIARDEGRPLSLALAPRPPAGLFPLYRRFAG